ncbi:hypothetical protein DL96DRAFT_1599659 [Flagelloscypha sp. PMI_526]|nr:hypothetical protein DL96DRAFT_1599659 [Flagelloscypha sp. PMI_526]
MQPQAASHHLAVLRCAVDASGANAQAETILLEVGLRRMGVGDYGQNSDEYLEEMLELCKFFHRSEVLATKAPQLYVGPDDQLPQILPDSNMYTLIPIHHDLVSAYFPDVVLTNVLDIRGGHIGVTPLNLSLPDNRLNLQLIHLMFRKTSRFSRAHDLECLLWELGVEEVPSKDGVLEWLDEYKMNDAHEYLCAALRDDEMERQLAKEMRKMDL